MAGPGLAGGEFVCFCFGRGFGGVPTIDPCVAASFI